MPGEPDRPPLSPPSPSYTTYVPPPPVPPKPSLRRRWETWSDAHEALVDWGLRVVVGVFLVLLVEFVLPYAAR